MIFLLNLAVSAAVISFCAWFSRSRPDLAGFVVSLPLTTLLTLALGHLQHGDSEKSVLLAKSVFTAIPASLLFFVPFLLAGRWRIPFWACYGSGIALLAVAFYGHRFLFSLLR